MAKKTKTNPLFAVITTDDQFAAAVNLYVEKSIELAEKKAALERTIAELNTQFDLDNAELIEDVAGLVGSAHLYADTHREQLFADSADEGPRSCIFRNAVVGFRWNPYKVEKRVSRDTFEAVAKRLAQVPWGESYLRKFDPEVDKDALLKAQANLTAEQLAFIGVKFTRDETFFIKAASESVADVKIAA